MSVCVWALVWRRENGVEIWGKTINRLCALMWLSSCGCSLSAENAEWWVQWEKDQWKTERGEREGGERWVKTEGVMTSFSGCVDKRKKRVCLFVCVLHTEKSESLCLTLFSYADQLVLSFTVHGLRCMFIYVNIHIKSWIKARTSHNTLSGSHVGAAILG